MQNNQRFSLFLPKCYDLTGSGGHANTFDTDETALEALKTAMLSLEGSRVYNLLADYRRRHGQAAREMAFLTYHHWRDGQQVCWNATASQLLDLLPHHLSEQGKFSLLQCLREGALKRLKPAAVKVILAHPRDLAAEVSRILPLLGRSEALDLPASVPVLLHWLSNGDMPALARIAEQTDRLLAARRLTDLAARLSQVLHLGVLADSATQIRVAASFVTPAAMVTIQFRESFWKERQMNDQADTDQDFLVRLQDLALTQEWQNGAMSYVDFVMRTLSPSEQEKLRAIAIAEGLRTEILLRELHVKTLAAKADIDLTIATVQNMKELHYHGRIISEHATASGTTRIEIALEPCLLLRPLTRWRKPKRLET